VFISFLKVPLNGVCWFIDELLFSEYRKVVIEKPLFFITGCRTGSTQLANYLEDDEANFVAPTIGESLFPFIWYWKFLKFTGAKQSQKTHKDFSQPQKEMDKRHNADLLRTGSFEICTAIWHFSLTSWFLGVDFMKWGFSFVSPVDGPIDNQFCNSFVQYYDSVVKKVLYYRGKPKQYVLVKGHFLMVANELSQRYEGAKFFTVVREPLDRFKSMINFFKVINKEDFSSAQYALCPTSWKVLRDYVIDHEILYCAEEQTFYLKSQGNRLVIPFNKYVNNLTGTLDSVYSFCNIPIPSHVLTEAGKIQNTTHDRQKRRASYDPKFNRSLSSLGVDEEKLKDELADYYQWIKQFGEN